MKLGTHIRMDDGRTATVVYNSLIGVGIKWGIHHPNPKDFEGTTGNLLADDKPDGWEWEPEALLRKPWGGESRYGFTAEQCVGDDYAFIGKEDSPPIAKN
jgi:hypothetical protein